MQTWTPQQDGALKAVDSWLKSSRKLKPFYLAGYAGTGKTTLAKHFCEHVSGNVQFAAYTGKAASVLRAKGCANATTLHSLLYNPVGSTNTKRIEELKDLITKEKSLGENTCIKKLDLLRKELRKISEKSRAMFELKDKYDNVSLANADLLVLDECSMIDEQMRKDIEYFKIPVLVLGDPGQLPPVGGIGGWAKQAPDYLLTEIHRQAKGSKIIWLATEVRHGRWPGWMDDPDCVIAPKATFDYDLAALADQVITGKNVTRRKLNSAIRKLKGFDKVYPLKGDKLICLKNNHDEGLLNGVTCTATSDSRKVAQTIGLDISYEGEDKFYYMDPGPFEETYYNRLSFPEQDIVQKFDYGYAITCHKSQGSQWKNVLICDDKMRSEDREMRKKWLYTAITRAEEKVRIYI